MCVCVISSLSLFLCRFFDISFPISHHFSLSSFLLFSLSFLPLSYPLSSSLFSLFLFYSFVLIFCQVSFSFRHSSSLFNRLLAFPFFPSRRHLFLRRSPLLLHPRFFSLHFNKTFTINENNEKLTTFTFCLQAIYILLFYQ